MTLRHLCILGCLTLAGLSACDTSDPDDGNTIEGSGVFTVQRGDLTLGGILQLPDGPGPYPAVILIQGSGNETLAEQGDELAVFYNSFTAVGVAALAYDKRGVGLSTGPLEGVSVANSVRRIGERADDVLAWVDFLKRHAAIDAAQIGFFASSQGGWVAPLAASRSADVAFTATFVGSGVSVGVEGYFSQLTGDAANNLLNDPLPDGLTYEAISDSLATFTGPHGFDPAPALEAMTMPALWVFGGEDRSHPTREAVAILERIKAEHNKDFTIKVFPYGNHDLNDVRTGRQLDSLFVFFEDWFLDQVDVPAPPSTQATASKP